MSDLIDEPPTQSTSTPPGKPVTSATIGSGDTGGARFEVWLVGPDSPQGARGLTVVLEPSGDIVRPEPDTLT